MELAAEGPMAIPLWINGHVYLSMGESLYDVVSPRTGETLRRVPLCGAGEAAQAVAAARAAQPEWAEMGLNARRVCLNALADGLEQYAGHFAKLLGQETLLDDEAAAAEVKAAVAALRAAEVGETGIVGVIVDAERPLSAAAAAIAPALLAGAAVVIKPSPRAPAAVFVLCELSARAEWPGGVLNLLQGDTAAIEGLCVAGVERLVYRGNAALGVQIGAIAEAAGTPFVLQAV